MMSERGYISVLIAFSVVVATLFFHFFISVLLPHRGDGLPISVVIKQGQGLSSIAQTLENADVLNNKLYFKILAYLLGRDKSLRAGTYVVSDKSNIYTLIKTLSGNSHDDIVITIPEGFSLKEIEVRLEEETDINYSLANFRISDFKEQYPFLLDAPNDKNLEGYIFPDTYRLKRGFSGRDFIEKSLENFGLKVNAQIQNEARVQGKTLFEIVTMASLIEKEIPHKDERPVVSGLLWKRLNVGMALQVDATVVYIVNKNVLSKDDLRVISPYNTYLNRGLPPGPIANPSLDAIVAALRPIESPYWYYLSKPTGETVFSRTLDEHNEARAKYLK